MTNHGDEGTVGRDDSDSQMERQDTPDPSNRGDFVDSSAHNNLSDGLLDDKPPKQIGPYKILTRIGEGGMGTVYRALQIEPIRREVAVKVIKLGMDTKEIIARFESERQALAVMSHPNIARVLDAGASSEGRPYFVMEYVKGAPITAFCDEHRLTIRDRLRVFVQVCEAVQHAHQKGIIHRDLKPTNILVTVQEGDRPIAKIIDFGIAKATQQQLTEKTLFTREGTLIGTPEYMSPEQTGIAGTDVDARTDIYSLGALLYELLIGVHPLSLRQAIYEEIVRVIREDVPDKPSTRVTSLSDAMKKKETDRRQADPQALVKQIRGDLDWITMKALEKDRTRRYSSASEFAADIERHLHSELVLAGPPSPVYRLQKYVWKRAVPIAIATTFTVFLALLAGGGTAIGFYFQAEERRVEAEEATNKAIDAKERETIQREKAQEAETKAVNERKKADEATEKADGARSVAEKQRDELLRLSDIKRLSELRDEADRLWPSYPEKIEAMEAWLAVARKIAGNLDEHQASLVELREEAVSKPQDGETGQSDDEENETSAGWKFADVETQWRHDVLTELVFGLLEFVDPDPRVGLIADVGERLVFARRVREETVERYDVEWEEAIASIANEEECPQYNGFEIKPQIGLVPIGKDLESGLWEFGHLQTGEIPDRDEEGKLEVTKRTSLIFVLIPGGKFWMGSQKADENKPNHDPQAQGNEEPVHEVALDPFFLSKYEMTQGQWVRFTKEHPSFYGTRSFLKKPGLHPVEQVTWDESDRVLSRLGLLLPTEAQWEYAARGGTTTAWWTGDDRDSLIGAANLADQAAKRLGVTWTAIKDWPEFDDGFAVHAPIGTYRANPFGVHDIHGNVWEWTRDGYTTYSTSVREGDGARFVEGARYRVIRGGSFNLTAADARSATRSLNTPEFRINSLGCRPSRRITTE